MVARARGLSGDYKIPVSTLVVIHTPALEVLLLERADRPGFWQSVTGSQHEGETLRADRDPRGGRGNRARRAARTSSTAWNLQNVYEIYPVWRHRYAPGVTHNTEHVFGLRVPRPRAGHGWRRASTWPRSGCRGSEAARARLLLEQPQGDTDASRDGADA